MQNAIVVTGRLVGPRNIELDEPVSGAEAAVQVIIHRGGDSPQISGNLVDLLRGLGPGSRSREDIDRALAEEREMWGRE